MSFFLIAGCMDLPKFTATKEWFLIAENSVEYINLKGASDLLTVGMEVLNGKCQLFGKMLLHRMPRFVSSRMIEARKYLKVGSHWN